MKRVVEEGGGEAQWRVVKGCGDGKWFGVGDGLVVVVVVMTGPCVSMFKFEREIERVCRGGEMGRECVLIRGMFYRVNLTDTPMNSTTIRTLPLVVFELILTPLVRKC